MSSCLYSSYKYETYSNEELDARQIIKIAIFDLKARKLLISSQQWLKNKYIAKFYIIFLKEWLACYLATILMVYSCEDGQVISH